MFCMYLPTAKQVLIVMVAEFEKFYIVMSIFTQNKLLHFTNVKLTLDLEPQADIIVVD